MKKRILTVFTVFLSAWAIAQETTTPQGEVNMRSKRGERILPVAGNLAVGIDANPFLTYIGGFLSNAGATAPNVNPPDGLHNGAIVPKQIYVKYYLADKTAIRATLRLQFISERAKARLEKDLLPTPDPESFVFDKENKMTRGYGLGVDYLKYRGEGRVQGYLGGGIHVYNQSIKNTYKYGNEMTTEFPNPNTWDFQNNAEGGNSDRVLSTYSLNDIGVSFRGIIGVEYFILPKVSLGGEMGLKLDLEKSTGAKTIRERWTGTEKVIETKTHASFPKKTKTFFDNYIVGNVFIMFHF